MDRLIKMFSKISGKKEEEKKLKEEEDLLFDTVLNFEIIPMKTNDKLNNLVKGIKIGGIIVTNFDSYNKSLDELMAQYNEEKTEIDYRFSKICEKTEIIPDINTNKIDKMKKVGKAPSESNTLLDETTIYGEANFTYNKFKVESKQGFCSIRANNCVFKNKWFYEAQIVSNNLQQIGWCQLSTPFTSQEGVGDDNTSFAYDGYRLVFWHSGKKNYGLLWDIGDIIGCCLDLEENKIEFFKNGVPLGIASDKVPVGENIAYFPAISLSQNEKTIFNFGQSPFQYSYPGYEPLDYPESTFNGIVEITAEILDLLKNSLLKIIMTNDSQITPYHKISLTKKILNYIAQVSFRDIFTFKTLLIPFMYDISSKNNHELQTFLDQLFIYLNKKEKLQLVSFVFDNLCGMIEENSIQGEKRVEEWKNLVNLFLDLLKIDYIVEMWIENLKTTENLKCVFNSNTVKMIDIYKFLDNTYNGFTSDVTVYTAFKHIKSEFCLSTNDNLENIYSENLKKVILMFLQDKRIFRSKSTFQVNNDSDNQTTLKSVLIDFVNKGYEFNQFNLYENLLGSINMKDHTVLYKNFIFNLYNIFTDYISKSLDTFSVEPFFSRLNQKSLYYDEIGIGGTINHVTSEYISNIDNSIREKSTEFYSELNHRIIRISTLLAIHLKEFSKLLEKYKSVQLKQVVQFEHGSDYFNKFFRSYFYLYTEANQTLLYQFSFFLIKWINYLVRKNKYIIYFIPKSVFDLPFDMFKFLHKIKANVLYNPTLRKKINETSTYFANDDYESEVVYFYTLLFCDEAISNPDIKESLILKIKFLMKKSSKLYEDPEIIELLIKGLLNYMCMESVCHIACEIMVKIIKPICFGQQRNFEKGNLVKVTQKFFEKNVKTFHEFMDNYSKLINKVMTDYTFTLNECAIKILNSGGGNPEVLDSKTALLKKLVFSYNLLCELMKIFEFLLAAYPYEFFDISTLNYSRFCNFLKNLSSRILEKTYTTQLLKLLEKTNSSSGFPGGVESFLLMAYSVIGIFLNIGANKDNPKYQEFINKLSNLKDLDMQPFLDLYSLITSSMEIDPSLKEGIQNYKTIVEFFNLNKEKKRDRTMSTEEWEETNRNEDLCIICYSNASDRVLLPCKHICCNECLMQYLSDKKNCFICNTHIEGTETFKPK